MMKQILLPLFNLIAALLLPSHPVAAADAPKPELPPALTPYLQNPAADGMTVCFVARGAEQVRVAWGAAQGSGLKELPGQGVAIAGTPWTIWKIRLARLQPGGAYQYQVRYRLGGAEAATPIRQFRTLDPRANMVRIIAYNDLHNCDATLAALMRHVQPDDYDFSLLLGDCWADPSTANGAYEVFRTLDAYVQLLDGASKPFLPVRGNHETRGGFARQLANLFDLPNLDASQPWGKDQWQFTLTAGPAFLLAMDTGEDDDTGTPTNSYKNPGLWQEVRQAESRWLENIVARRPYEKASWRIFLSHIPLFNSPHISVRARDCWLPQVEKFDPHLMLSGHDHTWRKPVPPSPQSPWPSLVGGGPALQGGEEGTVMILKASPQALQVRLLGAKDGRVLTEFTADKNAKPAQ